MAKAWGCLAASLLITGATVALILLLQHAGPQPRFGGAVHSIQEPYRVTEAVSAAKLKAMPLIRDDATRILVVRLFPGSIRYTLAAPRPATSNQLGEDLTRLLGGDVPEREIGVDDSSAFITATRLVESHEFGRLNLVQSYDLDAVLGRFRAYAPRGYVFVWTPRGATAEVEGLRLLVQGKDHAFYVPDRAAGHVSISLSAHFRLASAAKVIAALLLPVICGLLPAFLGWIVAFGRAPVESRRKRYIWTAYPLSAIAPFFLLPLLTAITGVTRSYDCSLVLGAWFEPAALVTAGAMVLLAAPLFALFGELLAFPPRPSQNVRVRLWFASVWPARGYWAGAVIGAAVAQAIFYRPGTSVVMMVLAPLLLPLLAVPALNKCRVAPELAELARRTGEHFGVKIESVVVLVDAAGWKATNAAVLSDHSIVLTGKAYADLTAREMTFLMTHEICHLARIRGAKPASVRKQLAFGSVAGFAIVFLLLGPAGLFGWAACLVFLGYVLTKACRSDGARRDLESEIDCQALRYTRDLESALSLMDRLEHPRPGREWLYSHPSKDRRKAALIACATELGLTDGIPVGS